MSSQIEIEYKILITKDIYQSLYDHHQSKIIDTYTQVNYYLTHPLFDQKKYMLRIRHKKEQYELTLKQPMQVGNYETTIPLSSQEVKAIMQKQPIDNAIFTYLKGLSIVPSDLCTNLILRTHRVDIAHRYGILSLDKNEYSNIIDYELEFEVNNKCKGYHAFLQIIAPYHLSYSTNCPSKLQRLKASQNKNSF